MSYKSFSSAQRASGVDKSNVQPKAAPATAKPAAQPDQKPAEVAPAPKS